MATLVRRARLGEDAALDGLIGAHYAALVRFCGRLLGADAAAAGQAQDLAQETLLRALQALGRLEDPGRFRAWLFGIAVHLAHKWRRRQARWPLSLEALAAASDRAGDALLPAAKTTEQLVEEAEQARRILGAVAALPPPERRVVVLYYLEGLSYRELVAALELPVSTIKWRLFSSRRRLRSRLGPRDRRRPAPAPDRAAAGPARTREGEVPMSDAAPNVTPNAPPPTVAEQLEQAVREQHRRAALWHGAMAQQRNLTEGAVRVFAVAEAEALGLNHTYVGTEHLLLGLLRDEDDLPARVLIGLGVAPTEVRDLVARRVGRGDRPVTVPPTLAPRAKNVVFQAVEDARRLQHDRLGTEHLLLGLVREGTGLAALILESLGADLDEVRNRVLHAVRSPAAE